MTGPPATAPAHRRLAALPTPLVRARGLQEALGSGPLWVKRDDLTGFGVAGNKARPLELLIGEALSRSADVLVAAGAPSSNFCAAAALAARVAGLDCDLLFAGPQPAGPSVNVALARAAGARLVFDVVDTREELDDAVRTHASTLRSKGRTPYAVPRGGATAVGAAGYALAATELAEQCRALDITPSTVVVATGSGGTQAGLVAGTVGHRLPWRVVGASVSRDPTAITAQVLHRAQECAARLGTDPPDLADVEVHDLRGPGFGVASEADRESARLALHHEGLLLDDTYGAKAMTLLRSLVADGRPGPIVFWHTGGVATALASLTREGHRP